MRILCNGYVPIREKTVPVLLVGNDSFCLSGGERCANRLSPYSVVLLLLPLLMVLWPSRAFGAEEFYRYLNKEGNVVISHYIPPELASRGYSVLSADGRVLRVVARQLSAAEVVQLERRKDTEKKTALAQQQARNLDRQLMQLYSSPEDVIYARDRKLASIDDLIAQTKSNIESLILQKRRLEKQGAELERSGQPLSGDILENLKIIEAQIQDRRKEIVKRHQEQQQVRKEFGDRLVRIRKLYGLPAPDDKKTKPLS